MCKIELKAQALSIGYGVYESFKIKENVLLPTDQKLRPKAKMTQKLIQ